MFHKYDVCILAGRRDLTIQNVMHLMCLTTSEIRVGAAYQGRSLVVWLVCQVPAPFCGCARQNCNCCIVASARLLYLGGTCAVDFCGMFSNGYTTRLV